MKKYIFKTLEKENDDRVSDLKKEDDLPVTPVRAMSSKLKRVRVDSDDEVDQPVKRSRKKKAFIESDSDDEPPSKASKKADSVMGQKATCRV